MRSPFGYMLPLVWGLAGFACLDPITSQAPVDRPAGKVEAVTTGATHACALLEGGSVRCWGAPGLVGDGTRSLRVEAVEVKGLSAGVLSLSAGLAHTCELSTSGHVKCWGQNARGELGLGDDLPRLEPVAIPELLEGVSQICAGASHSCALKSSGAVFCWGANDYAQLGVVSPASAPSPVQVPALSAGIRHIAAGAAHTCAVTIEGEVHCWGSNAHGELGNGVPSPTPSAAPVRVEGLNDKAMMVVAGRSHTCALTPAGAVWCWGQNELGALGDDTSIDRALPVQPLGLPGPAVSMSAGAGGTCAVLTSGDAWCWGNNANGQLGDGSRIHRARPVPVATLERDARFVSYGEGFSCGATKTLRAMCWGKNDVGQLGDGTDAPRETPGLVRGL
ncbi:MAG: hypothetical protein JNK82_09930 [Myxococcaceae bacterium]|nr:hypothetical protein [Myxococcaceae bacterium]